MLCTESGIINMHNMMQDEHKNDSLTASQRQLSHWHRRLGHMDFEKTKDFARKGFLPK